MSDRLFEALEAVPMIGLLRRLPAGRMLPLAREAVDAGLRAVEVTMDSDDAQGQLRALVGAVGPRAIVGAGTVVEPSQVDAALDGGASFLVAPDVHLPVIERAQELGIAIIPGALTPSEIRSAWRTKPTLVKVFPVGAVGPGYIRALRGPMPDIPLLATGGIGPESGPEFIAAGANAIAVALNVQSLDGAATVLDLIGALRRV